MKEIFVIVNSSGTPIHRKKTGGFYVYPSKENAEETIQNLNKEFVGKNFIAKYILDTEENPRFDDDKRINFPGNKRPVCVETMKTIYSSKKDAKYACRRVPNKFRTYHCEECGGWHITHEEKA